MNKSINNMHKLTRIAYHRYHFFGRRLLCIYMIPFYTWHCGLNNDPGTYTEHPLLLSVLGDICNSS